MTLSKMNVPTLKTEIESTHFHAFWYGSPLLQQCVNSGSQDLVPALALRHHGLQNKDAGSCHVLRQTIIRIDGPEFPALWSMFDSDPDDPATTIESPLSPLWAAAYILGEIGGLCAFRGFSDRLSPEHAPHHFAVVRGLVHVIDRYRIISEEGEPMGTLIDTKTGEQKRVCTKDIDPEAYTRTIKDRTIANRHFDAPPPQFLSELKLRLSRIDSAAVRFEIDRIIGFVDLVFPQADVQDRINAEMARRFLERPDLVDLSKAKIIDDDAAEILAIHKGELYLDGLISLSNAAAESLGECQGVWLSLGGLKSLSDAAAEALIKQVGGNLVLDGLTHLSDTAAEALAKQYGGSLSLDGLPHLSDAAAAALAKQYGGYLSLDGLTHLSDAAAEVLAEHQGDSLSLNGVTHLSDAAVVALAKQYGHLSLDGLTHLSIVAAEALAEHQGGNLSLNGLTYLSDAAVEALSRRSRWLSLNGLTCLSNAAVKALSQNLTGLFLDGLATLSDADAEALSKLGGSLSLNGLTSLSDLAAEALSRHSGGLYLNRLTSLSNVAAEAFSRHQGLLQLYGLTNLSEAAALALSKHRGLLWLNRAMESQVFPK